MANGCSNNSSSLRVYSFRLSTSSTLTDSRVRWIEMMIASPTAASAAATVMTMNTKSCPPTSPKKAESDTSARFTAFSISSMHMKIVIALRFMNTPTAPIVNKSADSARYQVRGAMLFLLVVLASGQHHRAHDRHQYQHRCDFKR